MERSDKDIVEEYAVRFDPPSFAKLFAHDTKWGMATRRDAIDEDDMDSLIDAVLHPFPNDFKQRATMTRIKEVIERYCDAEAEDYWNEMSDGEKADFIRNSH